MWVSWGRTFCAERAGGTWAIPSGSRAQGSSVDGVQEEKVGR